jgi:HlyD family secretion protein
MKSNLAILSYLIPILFSCSGNNDLADAYGNFEAVEVIISAEANGKLMSFNLEEGDLLQKGQLVGYVDSVQLYLSKKQLQASIEAIRSKTQNVKLQIDVLENKKQNLEREKARIERLLADSAATSKQYDDIAGELDVVERQIVATRSQLNTSNRGLLSEIEPLELKIQQIDDQLEKCLIMNPEQGTVLSKYAYENEVTAYGKPLYKIADLEKITLRAYVSGNQLANINIGQDVKVKIDENEGEKEFAGKVTWVSSKAEFTPKVIQTKEERVNLVYAFKVLVSHNGEVKIGMPGEVHFN